MDCPNIEKSKGFKSKIPVRAIKPPNRLPVPNAAKENESRKNAIHLNAAKENESRKNAIHPNAAKENESRKNQTKPKVPVIVNASSKPQINSKKTIDAPTSRRVLLPPSQNARRADKESIKTVTNRRLTNAAVNKKSTCSGNNLANIKITKVSNIKSSNKETVSENRRFTAPNQLANKKPLYKETVIENKRLTGFACQNKNEKLTSYINRDINRRFTNIATKTTKKPIVIERNIVNQRLTNVNKIETNKHTNFGMQFKRRSIQKAKHSIQITDHVKQLKNNKQKNKVTSKESNLIGGTDKSIKATNNEVNVKTNILFNQKSNCPFNVEDQPQDVNKTIEDKNPLQPDIEFVADERYRNQILFGKGISPNLKFNPVKNSMINDRSSFFLKPNVQKALEQLEEEGRRASMMRMSGLCPTSALRPSQPTKCYPYQAVLRALENVDLAAEDRRVSTMKKNGNHFSPRLERSPTFKQTVDPCKTALKRIEALELKRKAKSTKKVTFNLESSDSPSKVLKHSEQIDSNSFREVKPRDVIDKKKEDYKCSILKSGQKESTPELQLLINSAAVVNKTERRISPSHYHAMLLRICDKVNPHNETDLPSRHTKVPHKQTESMIHSDRTGSASTLVALSTIQNKTSPLKSILLPQNVLKKGFQISDSVGPCFRTYNTLLGTLEDSRNSLYSSRSQTVLESEQRRSTLSRLCTPKPISFFSKPGAPASISPEFLCRRTSQIVAHAPISTPMVLRSLAADLEDSMSPMAQVDFSPICQRLDFDEIEKETANEPVQVSGSPYKIHKLLIQSIVTNQQHLDRLADEECSAILSIPSSPVISQRNFWNPVAQILSHGDDMHFVPLKLQ